MATSSETFKLLETAPEGTTRGLATMLDALRFDAAGLVPAIAQDATTGEVLMLAWMNRAAIEETLATGRVCYWSRSRGRLWRKGEQSGQIQRLRSLRVDCDGDSVLLAVDQDGPACHTGRRSCFYLSLSTTEAVVDRPVLVDPKTLYSR